MLVSRASVIAVIEDLLVPVCSIYDSFDRSEICFART